MKPLRDLLKHSSVYAVGQILTRMASVLLLPFYTYCLTPADYGVTAILDLTGSILSIMIGAGMVSAVTRFHFDSDAPEHHDRLWWTGLTYMATTSCVVLFPLWLGRQVLADLTLGENYLNGGWLYTLTLATILVQVIGQMVDAYLRVHKWSGVFVAVSFGRLLLNVSLNVTLLAVLKLGVEGLLIGNLIASLTHTCVLLFVFMRTRGRYHFDFALSLEMLRFSAPLVVTALLSMLMHESDRYFLRVFVSMDQVGIYSLAHKIGFAVNTLCLLPFASIWHVAIYDIDRMPEADAIFRRVFRWFVGGMGILLLGASLTVHPILPLLTPIAYSQAIDLIAVVLLGFFLFGLQFMFEVPALLTKRTGLLVPGSIAGVIVNCVLNRTLIPYYGVWGAAWAGVVTYIVFSFTTLYMCRSVRSIPYPWAGSLLTFSGICASYVGLRFGLFPGVDRWTQLALSVTCCGLWAIALFGREALEWWSVRRTETTNPLTVVEEEVAIS